MKLNPERLTVDFGHGQSPFRKNTEQSHQFIDDFPKIESFRRVVVLSQQVEKLIHEPCGSTDRAGKGITDICFTTTMCEQSRVAGGR